MNEWSRKQLLVPTEWECGFSLVITGFDSFHIQPNNFQTIECSASGERRCSSPSQDPEQQPPSPPLATPRDSFG